MGSWIVPGFSAFLKRDRFRALWQRLTSFDAGYGHDTGRNWRMNSNQIHPPSSMANFAPNMLPGHSKQRAPRLCSCLAECLPARWRKTHGKFIRNTQWILSGSSTNPPKHAKVEQGPPHRKKGVSTVSITWPYVKNDTCGDKVCNIQRCTCERDGRRSLRCEHENMFSPCCAALLVLQIWLGLFLATFQNRVNWFPDWKPWAGPPQNKLNCAAFKSARAKPVLVPKITRTYWHCVPLSSNTKFKSDVGAWLWALVSAEGGRIDAAMGSWRVFQHKFWKGMFFRWAAACPPLEWPVQWVAAM